MSIEVAGGSLVLNAVKLAYELWKDGKAEALALSEAAKTVLATMQTDPTDNGVFMDATGDGGSGVCLQCTNHGGISISTTRRVIAELEAKGLVTTARDDSYTFRQEYIKLTHFGWILNPQTGEADKLG